MLFESAWKDGWDYYERVFNPDTKKSIVRKTDNKWEYYSASSTGIYSYLIDSNIKLTKQLSSSQKDTRDQYGVMDPLYKNIRDNYWSQNKYNLKPRVWYLDIETRATKGFPEPQIADQEITLIQIFDSFSDTVILLGQKEFKHQENYKFDYKFKYINCGCEVTLLNTYFKLFKELNPLFIYAWNGLGFDYPYMYTRLKNLGMDVNLLSNYGEVKYSHDYDKDNDKHTFKLDARGHFYIDMMDVYKKFILSPRDSYSLENIATVELNEHKVDHSEYATFDDFYLGNYILPDNPTEHQKSMPIYKAAMNNDLELMRELGHAEFCYYGYKDPVLIYRLDKKLNFTAIMNSIADRMGVMVSDTLGTVKPWSQYLSNVALQMNLIMPPRQEFEKPDIVGGFVKDPTTGLHYWCMSADVNSMYPLLGMVGFNMSPETFIPIFKLSPEMREIVQRFFNDQDESKRFEITKNEWDYIKEIAKRDNVSIGINGAIFDKSKLGIIPRLVQEIYNGRKQAKKTMFKFEQRKVLIKDILHTLTDNNKITLSEFKDVLEYSEEDLKTFSEETLKELQILAEDGEAFWNTQQLTEKVLMNSLYGALSNQWFPLFNEKIAAAITGNGRYFIRKKSNYIEETLQKLIPYKKQYILYNDTDAAYYHIEPFMDRYMKERPNESINHYVDWANAFEEKIIQPAIQRAVDDFSEELNAYNKDVIKSEREIIADRLLFTAKKKYIARVRDAEGTRYPEDDPKIKIMGLEIIKSSTPKFSKVYLKKAIPVILDKSEMDLKYWLNNVIKPIYMKTPIPELAGTSTIGNVKYNPNELDKNGRPKALTAGTKSALAYNNYIEKTGKSNIYQKISSGDKTKKIYLQMPNKLHSNIVAFNSDNFGKEIQECIDYDVNFEKTFLKPLQLMINPLKWNIFNESDNSDW